MSLFCSYQIVVTRLSLLNCHLTKLSLPNCPYKIDVTKNPPVGQTRIPGKKFSSILVFCTMILQRIFRHKVSRADIITYFSYFFLYFNFFSLSSFLRSFLHIQSSSFFPLHPSSPHPPLQSNIHLITPPPSLFPSPIIILYYTSYNQEFIFTQTLRSILYT